MRALNLQPHGILWRLRRVWLLWSLKRLGRQLFYDEEPMTVERAAEIRALFVRWSLIRMDV